jgi:uncharacterized protein (DUF433 family)
MATRGAHRVPKAPRTTGAGWRERIVVDPAIAVGKPVVRGTRLAVDFVVGLLADGWVVDDLVAEYPGLAPEDVQACLRYATDVLRSEAVHPLPA